MRPERKSNLPPYVIVIEGVSGGDIANILRGHIEVAGERIRFTGVAYGRYGGQNVAPQLSRASKKKVKEVFGDVPKFEEDLQMRLVSGEFEIKPKPGVMPPH